MIGFTMSARSLARLATAVLLAFAAGCSPSTSTAPPEPGPLSGVVLDTLGVPTAGAIVIAQTLRASDGIIESISRVTDASGAFGFGPVAPTDWLLGAFHAGLAAADTARVPAPGRVLVLRRAGAVRGRALLTGSPRQDGTQVTSDLLRSFDVTDSSGAFELGDLPAGGWWLYLERPFASRDTAIRFVIPAPGDTVVVPDIVLTPIP